MMKRSWIVKNFFSSKWNSFVSVVFILFLVWVSWKFLNWALIESVWIGGANECRMAQGACLSFIRAKWEYIIFGAYPRQHLWRPLLGMLMITAFFISIREPGRVDRFKVFLGLAVVLTYHALLAGWGPLEKVENRFWGGLPLTLFLSMNGLLFAYPLGILLALGRRSEKAALKAICVGYIELIRGVPLISLLFMASVMFPLFTPEGVNFDKLLRAQVAIIGFIAAYMAEVVRGGLQAVPKEQYEAAASLGLNWFQTMRLVVLPQALRKVIPPTVNTAIGMFKDTSLVMIIALFDLMATTKSSLTDTDWLGFSVEAYLFVAAIYFAFCFYLGRYSRKLEIHLAGRGQS